MTVFDVSFDLTTFDDDYKHMIFIEKIWSEIVFAARPTACE